MAIPLPVTGFLCAVIGDFGDSFDGVLWLELLILLFEEDFDDVDSDDVDNEEITELALPFPLLLVWLFEPFVVISGVRTFESKISMLKKMK